MRVGDIIDLKIIAVLDKGSPNKECIAIQAIEEANLGQYGIMLGMYSGGEGLVPFRDNLFWFGDGIVNKGDWIFIYTGAGEPRESKTADQKNNVYSIFWGKSITVFANPVIAPLLFRVDAVDILLPPENVPQIGNA